MRKGSKLTQPAYISQNFCESLQQKKLFLKLWHYKHEGFPGGSDSKGSARNMGDLGLMPGLGRSPREGNGYPLHCYCLENSTDRGAWQGTVDGITKSWTWLSDQYTHTSVKPLGTPDRPHLIHDEPSQEMEKDSFLQHIFEHLSSAMLEVRSIHGPHIFFCCSLDKSTIANKSPSSFFFFLRLFGWSNTVWAGLTIMCDERILSGTDINQRPSVTGRRLCKWKKSVSR